MYSFSHNFCPRLVVLFAVFLKLGIGFFINACFYCDSFGAI